MAAPRPRFSIVMPTRNHARWIETAARSVLDQNFAGPVEFVVYDALSDDGTAEILSRYQDRLTWRREKDHGQVDAINRGLAAAKGEILAWLNSDDLYLPGALRQVHDAFTADPALDFVYGDALEIDEDGRILTPNLFTEDCAAERYLYSHNFMCQPTVFLRREAVARIGALRDDLRWFMDYEWFSRLHRAGCRGRRLPHFIAANRDHPSTKTNSGGLARWWEAMRVFAAHSGPFLLRRRSIWIYSLEYVIKSLNAAGWAAPVDLPIDKRDPRQRTVDHLNAWLMRLVRPRSFDDIARRFGTTIAPLATNVSDLWRAARPPDVACCVSGGTSSPGSAPSDEPSLRSRADGLHRSSNPSLCSGTGLPPSMPDIVPLAPELTHAYPALVGQMHEALRQFMFPRLPSVEGRLPLMNKLLGTGIPEAMYVLAELHAALGDDGDLCEFGVAQGATSALLANEIRPTSKVLWLYDSFEGLPKPSPQDQLKDDIFRLGSMERYQGEMRCDAAEVQIRLNEIGFPPERYRICPGWINETLREGAGPASVCFAYVDFDFYEPIRDALVYLARHLTPNGRIVVDDYDFFSTGAKTAVDEFVQQHPEFELAKPEAWAGAFCLLRRRRHQS